MAFLYINTKGIPWTKHSFSAGLDYDQSPKKYYYRRILGFKERDNKAALLFGRAWEQAVQFYHDNNGTGIVEKFTELWAAHKDKTDISYTKTERDWPSLNKAGTELARLYIIRQPSLPIPLGGQSVFQREYSKEVFPNDPLYGGIEDAGKLDIICYVDPNHPMLTKVEWKPEYGILRPLIVDMKATAADLPERPGLAAFDKQLRRYSWQSGIRDVAFLWAKKCGHTVQKGSSVTLLVDAGEFKAGDEAVAAYVDKESESAYIVHNDFMIEEMEKYQGKKEDGSTDQTKAAKARKMEWLEKNAPLVKLSDMTRQRLQFNSGFVSIESANEAGQTAARQIVGIVNSWKNKSWPNEFGIRFPHCDLNDPYFRAFVLNDEAYRKENFRQSDQDEFDDLFDEPEDDI